MVVLGKTESYEGKAWLPGVRMGGGGRRRGLGARGLLRVLVVWQQLHGPAHALKFTGLRKEKGQSYSMAIVKV